MNLYEHGWKINDRFEKRFEPQQTEDLPLAVAIMIGVQLLVGVFLIVAAIAMH
ncbi:MAG TPA: hypothetical protein VLV32_03725 [Burkholderiales bacterium]|jgi:hypothetical protein|nr:hypothetical protein [Burkholderiales bacterium]